MGKKRSGVHVFPFPGEKNAAQNRGQAHDPGKPPLLPSFKAICATVSSLSVRCISIKTLQKTAPRRADQRRSVAKRCKSGASSCIFQGRSLARTHAHTRARAWLIHRAAVYMLLVLYKSYRRKIFPIRPENISVLTGKFFRTGGEKKLTGKIFRSGNYFRSEAATASSVLK